MVAEEANVAINHGHLQKSKHKPTTGGDQEEEVAAFREEFEPRKTTGNPV